VSVAVAADPRIHGGQPALVTRALQELVHLQFQHLGQQPLGSFAGDFLQFAAYRSHGP
jgi:hypothetical protein